MLNLFEAEEVLCGDSLKATWDQTCYISTCGIAADLEICLYVLLASFMICVF